MSENSHPIVLRIQGSHVPSFKNSKMLTRGKLITKPERQKWMEACINSFMRQLLYSCPMGGNVTATGQKVRSWIASVLPENDSCKHLTACSWRFYKSVKGREGAELTITKV